MGEANTKGQTFAYVEFIRNPLRENNGSANRESGNLQWIAFDYFDYIYIGEAGSFRECMDYQNNIPCEAYQSIGLFKDKEDDDIEIMRGTLPFLAVMQVTIMPEVYLKAGQQDLHVEVVTELKKTVEEAEKLFKETHESCKLKYKVFYTVNNVDFCILINSDYLDLAEYISNHIKAVKNQQSYKYSVYTTISVNRDFEPKYNKCYMGDGTALVARVLLDRAFYLEGIANDFLDNLKVAKEWGEHINITDTHTLPGTYELSIRVNGSKDVIDVLKLILRFNCAWLKNEEKDIEKFDQEIAIECSVEEMEQKNAIFFLIKRQCVKYLNVRVFFSGEDTLSGIEGNAELQPQVLLSWDGVANELLNDLKGKFEQESDDYVRSILEGYLQKLKRIVNTCHILSSNDDTRVSMKMLQEYLASFLQLLKLHENFLEKDLISPKDYAINFLTGINYIQQYTKIVTSVNGSSFETPQFGIERDECSIGKLPIAYTEFLGEVFGAYYEKRKSSPRPEDSESEYFPMYLPLVVPYMQDGSKDFMMSTLLAQNMSDDWSKVQGDWEQYIQDENKVLMFIICQDMDKYRDVSALLVASFHEIGHYCNRITRRERNDDLIKIFSEVIAEKVVQRWIGLADTGYLMMLEMEMRAEIVTDLVASLYEELCNYFRNKLKSIIDYPKSVFIEKFVAEFRWLASPFLNCHDNLLKDVSSDNIYYTAAYEFGLREEIAATKELSANERDCRIFQTMKDKAIVSLRGLEEDLEGIIAGWEGKETAGTCMDGNVLLKPYFDNVQAEDIKCKVCEITEYIKKLLVVWEKLSFDENIEETGNVKDLEDVAEKVDITKFMQREFCGIEEQSKTQLEGFGIIRDLLENAMSALSFCLRLCDKIIIDDIVEKEMIRRNTVGNRDEKYSLKDMEEERIEPKRCFMNAVCVNYLRRTNRKFADMSLETDRHCEIYAKMYIMPDDNQMPGFIKSLDEVLRGLSVPSSQLDLVRSCYEESMADIIMCANLNLDPGEYLEVVKNYFNKRYEIDSQWKIIRLVVVLSYLWFMKPETERWDGNKEKLTEKFGERLELLMDGNSISDSVLILVGRIKEKYQNLIERRMFDIIMNRINSLKSYLLFFDNSQDIEFIHRDLKKRLSGGNSNKDKSVQSQEIAFLLKYYYKNRKKYSLMLQKDEEKTNDQRRTVTKAESDISSS